MKTIVLMVSKVFPAYHPRKGDYTDFKNLILAEIKKHTLRGNYELWKNRVEMINSGKAYLSLRQWQGRPYHSKQEEFLKLYKVGVQLVEVKAISADIGCIQLSIDEYFFTSNYIAKNDGLSEFDMYCWFKKCKKGQRMAIIHFTGFRY